MVKRPLLTTLVALLTVSSATFFASCRQPKGGQQDSIGLAPDTFATECYTFTDTLQVIGSQVDVSLRLAFPASADTSALADSIRRFLLTELVQAAQPYFGEDEPSAIKLPEGIARTPAVLLDTVGRISMAYLTAYVDESAREGLEVTCTNDYSAAPEHQTATFVTYSTQLYTYLGGAHGSTISAGHTFRRSDGRHMGWNMVDTTRKAELTALIRDGLKEYFAEGEDLSTPLTDAELLDRLLLWDDPDTPEDELSDGIPLPHTAPWLTPTGVAFLYQQYEIAPYAVGMPNMTIPFEVIAPLLTAEGRSLLP